MLRDGIDIFLWGL